MLALAYSKIDNLSQAKPHLQASASKVWQRDISSNGLVLVYNGEVVWAETE